MLDRKVAAALYTAAAEQVRSHLPLPEDSSALCSRKRRDTASRAARSRPPRVSVSMQRPSALKGHDLNKWTWSFQI